MIRSVLLCLFVVVVSACGGGGSGGSQSSTSPTTPTTSAPPPSTDLSENGWTATKPTYSGKRTSYVLDNKNVVETVYSTLESLDLLTSLAFADQVSNFYFIAANQSNALSGEASCEMGAFTEDEVEAQKRLEFNYQECQIDGVKLNGRLRVSRNSGNVLTIMPALTMQDMTSGETLTLSGYYTVAGTDHATFFLLLETNTGEQLWLDNFKLRTSYYGSDYGIDFSGDLYLSGQGKLNISTVDLGSYNSGKISTKLQLEGTEVIEFDVTLQHFLTLQYGQDYLPITVPLDESAVVDFDMPNTAPVATTSKDSYTVTRNGHLSVSAELSSDVNFDLLRTEWEIIAKPVNSNVNLEQGNQVSLVADRPGDYVLRLTVTDSHGIQATKDIAVSVLKSAPQGQIAALGEFKISQPISAQIELLNDEHDGPMDYYLKYGPANMKVSRQGLITWDGVIPDYGKDTDVNFAVLVSNQDAHHVLEHTITLKSNSSPILSQRNTPARKAISAGTRGESGKWYDFDGLITEISTVGNQITERYHDFFRKDKGAKVHYQATSDVNRDGVDDFWYSQFNVAKKQFQVYWLDGASGKANLFKKYEEALNSVIKIQTLDYDQDGDREVFLSTGYLDNQIFDADTGELLMERDIDITGKHYCDFNQDGFLDIMDVNTFSPKPSMDLISGDALASIEQNGNYIDADGTSVCEYYIVEDNQLYYQRFPSENRISLLDVSNYLPSSINLFHADVDGDGQQEILFSGNVFGVGMDNFLIDYIGTDKFSITKLDYDIPSVNSVQDRRYFKDINNDGVDEILLNRQDYREVNDNEYKTFWEVIAYNLSAEAVTQVMQSDTYSADSFELVHWYDDKRILTKSYESSGSYTLEIDQNDNVSHRFLGTSYADLAVDGTDIHIYQRQAGTGFAAKTDLSNNPYWVTDVNKDEPFGIDDVDVLSNGLVWFAHYQAESLLNSESGEIMLTIPSRYSYTSSPYVSNLGEDGINRFVSIGGRTLVEINSEKAVKILTSPELEEAFGDSSHYTFSQADKDVQPEIIVYSTFSKTYRIFDTVTLLEQEGDIFHSGKPDFPRNIPSRVELECFEWDKSCRNYVGRDDRGYNVVDKLTGKIIWKSPTMGRFGSSFHFKRAGNEIQTIITAPNNWVVALEDGS